MNQEVVVHRVKNRGKTTRISIGQTSWTFPTEFDYFVLPYNDVPVVLKNGNFEIIGFLKKDHPKFHRVVCSGPALKPG